jgi:ER membrane protein complex subunit 4
MNGFMLYMSGNSVQIFSIMITIMLLWNSVNAILGSLQSFQQFYASNVDTTKPGYIQTVKNLVASKLILPVLVFSLMNVANLGLGIWKCGAMGLLPTTSSDWLSFMEPKQVIEIHKMIQEAVGGFLL